MKTTLLKSSPLIVILIFSILGTKALFHPGLYTAHDIWHQVVRLYYYSQAISDGQFPPYWIGQLANGFGYPLFFFSYHLPWLIGEVFIKSGFNIFDTIKSLFFLSYLASGITMYLFVNSLLKNKLSALLTSILYLWLPYHFLIIFVGASIGIAFIFVFLPLVFLGISQIKEQKIIGIPTLALGLSGIILSHIMHLVFLAPLILIFSLWAFLQTGRKVRFLTNIIFGALLGILISSFYLLPAIIYSPQTRVSQESGFATLYQRHFVNFQQIIYSKWGYGPIVNNAKNGESSFQLGFAQWAAVLALTSLLLLGKIKTGKTLGIFTLAAFALSVFLMLDYSKFIWVSIIKFVNLDFPFRLLLSATFAATICAGVIIVNLKPALKVLFMIFLISIALYTNRNHINVNLYTDFPLNSYLDLESEITTNTFHEYLPRLANAKLLNKPYDAVTGESIKASNIKQTTNILSFGIQAQKETEVSVGQFAFPGQTVFVDGKFENFKTDNDGKISFKLNPGAYIVETKYQESLVIQISKALTLIGIIAAVIIFLKGVFIQKKVHA